MKRLLVIGLFSLLAKVSFSQCNPPAALNVLAATNTSITITFIGNGPAPYQIQYGEVGFQIGSRPTITIPANTYLIQNLNGASSYDFYVRDTCTNGLVSVWIGPYTFNTLCTGIVQAPVAYTFDASNWEISQAFSMPGKLAACWGVAPIDTDYSWTVGPGMAINIQTGPSADHTTGFGKYLHVANFGLSPQLVTSLVLPKISLAGLSSPELKFWYHMYGSGIDKLEVLVKPVNATSWDTIQRLVGEQQLSKLAPWQQSVLSLSNFQNDTLEFRFLGYRTSTGPYVEIAIDDLSVGNFQTCPDPSDFHVVSNSQNGVLLNWLTGSASNWKIEYGPAGHILGSGTKLIAAQKPFQINGLLPNTAYQFYVRDSCGVNDVSNWVGPLYLKTDCPPITAPYSQNFEDSTWVKPVLLGQFGTLNPCWKNQHQTNFFWDVGPMFFPNSFSGPSGDHTTGNGKFLFTNRDVFWGLDYANVTTPIIDLAAIAVPELSFWYHLYGGNIAGLDVAVDSGAGFVNVLTINGQQQTSSIDAWRESIISLPVYAGKKVKIRFKGRSNFAQTNVCNLAIDDFLLRETPPCPKPTQLSATTIGYTTAKLSWATGGASHWIIRYKPTSGIFAYFATATNPHTLSGLQANTEYEVWIKDSCGLNNVSVWNGPLTFSTKCTPKPTPYFENFEGNGFVRPAGYLLSGSINSCWNRDFDEGFYWETGPPFLISSTTGPMFDHTFGGGKYMVSDMMNFVTRDTTYLLTPEIDLGNLVVPEMAFWYHMFGTGIFALQIEIDSGTGWMLLDTLFGQQQFVKSDPWQERIVDLSAFADDTIQLRFVSIRNAYSSASEIAIDDLHIYEQPTCTKPQNLAVLNVRSTEATLNWASSATNWVVKYVPGGGATNFIASAANNPFKLSSLLPNTRYQIWVRDSCGVGDVGLWVGPLIFRTDCTPTQTPYFESFDSQNWQPAFGTGARGKINTCWKISDTTYLSWIPYAGNATNSLTGPSGPRSGTGNFMLFNNISSSLPLLTSEFTSPAVIIANLTLPELNFYYHMYGAQIGKLEVFAEYLNGNRTLLHTLNGQQQSSKTAPWALQNIPLTSYVNDTIKIVFVGHKAIGFSSTFNIAIDDVEIVDAFCANPTNLSATNLNQTTATLQWQSANVRSNIEYGVSGFTLGQGTVLKNVTSPHTITGLQAATHYQFYILDSCRATNSSWVGPYSFSTFCDTPSAAFSYANQTTAISFNASATTGTGVNYNWDFGDGTFGVGVNPVHTYIASSSYLVTLSVTDSCGLTDTATQRVTVCGQPMAVINYTVNGTIVFFDGTQSTSAKSYYWDFGAAGTFTNAQPNVAFPGKAVYAIYLAITDSCGGKDTAFMQLDLCVKPTALFTYQIISSGAGGMVVNFDGSFSQNAQFFNWDFGDGTTDTTSLSPTHTYTVPGLHYLVTLITYGDCGRSDTLSYKLQDVVSVEESAALGIKVYPNPARDKLVVELPENTNQLNFTWYNAEGKHLSPPILRHSGTILEFNLAAFQPGVYLLVVRIGEADKAIKIVVE